ncbi:MAG: hypothetical protein JXB00_18050 [Bacteroidales bacterium]|nr:hypothetical protein [Bacteroidales bacterium]
MKYSAIILFLIFFIVPLNAQYAKTFGFRPLNKANTEIIRSVSSEYQGELWQFPGQVLIDTSQFGKNIFGAGRYKPMHNIKNIEPASFSNVYVLKNGSILAICPVKFDFYYSSSEIMFKALKLYYPSQVTVFLLDKTGGKIIWEECINASGNFTIEENENYIIIYSQNFVSDGIRGMKIHLLNKLTGKTELEKGHTSTGIIHFDTDKNLVTLIEKDSLNKDLLHFRLYKTDKAKPLLSKDFTSDELMFLPQIIEDKILFLCNNKMCLHDFRKSKNIWEFEVDTNINKHEIRVIANRIFIPLKEKIVVSDLTSGRKLWDYPINKDEYAGLYFIGNNIYLIQQNQKTKELDKKTQKLLNKKMDAQKLMKKYKKKPFELIDIEQFDYKTEITSINSDGKKNWSTNIQGILNSNIYSDNTNLFLTTNNYLYCIDNHSGTVIEDAALFENNRFRQNFITQIGTKLIIRNDEWVHCLKTANLDSLYTHHFELVCPAFSQEELDRDKATGNFAMEQYILGRSINSNNIRYTGYKNTYNAHYNDAVRTGGVTGSTAHSYASYHQSLDNLSGDISNSIGLAMNMLNMSKNMYRILALRNYLAQLDAYPYVQHEATNLTNLDNNLTATRLVKKTANGQKFIALEILELETGLLKSQIISPFQFKEDVITMYTNFGFLFSFTGYAHAINIREHILRTSIDWKNERIYHYGPGLNVDTYKYYDKDSEFARGKLLCLPFDFKVEKRYL